MGAPNRGIPGRPGCNPALRRRRDAAAQVQTAEKEETAGMEQYSATGCRAGPLSGWVRAPHRRSPLRRTRLAWRPHAFPFVSVVRPHQARGARRFLGASSVSFSSRCAHCAHELSPGIRLAGFGGDPRLEIGELRRKQSAPFGAGRIVFERRWVGPRIHGVKSPKSGGGKRDDNHRNSRRPG
jgi:hypothetical protein